jgi:hypothetical protein
MLNGSFFSEAETFLRTSAQSILEQFLARPREGQWHPNGFAVFHLGDVKGLGQMRFHVWPRGIRVALDGQPAIHSHPWELCSLVIAGCYRDTLYRAREFEVGGPGRLQKFDMRFGSGDEGDQVCPVAVWYEVEVAEERTVSEGSFHQMRAGVLHASQIPLDAFAATLLITGKVIDLSKLLLVGDGTFGKRSYVRPAVSAEELDQIHAELINANTI